MFVTADTFGIYGILLNPLQLMNILNIVVNVPIVGLIVICSR